MKQLYICLILLLAITGCWQTSQLEELAFQYQTGSKYELKDSLLKVYIFNPLKCPLRIWVQSENKEVTQFFDAKNPILLNSGKDSVFNLTLKPTKKFEIDFASRFGDIEQKIKNEKVVLPFPKGYTYRVVQGNNTTFTHNNPYSKYAIDFDLQPGDTITAIAPGYVVGVIETYTKGGAHKRWRDNANTITIYHPEMKLFSQYVHLDHQGSFVELGDTVISGESIGLSGMTGYTTTEHLHFSLLKPAQTQAGLESVPMTFEEGYEGIKMKKNDIVKNY